MSLGGPIAQLVEPPAHNRLVVGSSPTGPTMLLPSRGVNSVEECHPHTVEVVGSSPIRPTIVTCLCKTLQISDPIFPLMRIRL